MPIEYVICITIDGLRASALGAYGNTWHPTPALDALASQSRAVDWMYCERPTLDGFFDAIWRCGSSSLIQKLAADCHTSLTTDDADTAQRGEACGFAEVRHLEFTSPQAAATVADTQLAQLFAVAIDQVAAWADDETPPPSTGPRRLLWLHARGYRGAWDAPLELRESLLDEDDPQAPTFVAPPAHEAVTDHDELLLFRAGYAAQTMVLDACVDALMTALVEDGLDERTMLVLASPRGFALGEHAVVGAEVDSLYEELLHIPCLVRVPGDGPGVRIDGLAHPGDVFVTIVDAASPAVEPAAASGGAGLLADGRPGRNFVIAVSEGGERAIRTPAWMLRERRSGGHSIESEAGNAVELYLKPDDRWEANEISSRMPDVAARLLALLVAAQGGGDGAEIVTDDDLLSHGR
jgi:arylsulfatase A-like enzyme